MQLGPVAILGALPSTSSAAEARPWQARWSPRPIPQRTAAH